MDEVLSKDYFSFTVKIAKELYNGGKTLESLMCYNQLIPFIENLSAEEHDKIYNEFGDYILLLDSIAIDLENAGKIEMSEVARKTHLIYDPSYIWYGNLGSFYLRRKDFVKAKSYLEKALGLFDSNEDDLGIKESLGLLYLELGEYENAAINLSRAREVAFENGEENRDLSKYGGNKLIQNIYLSLYDDYFPKHHTDFCLLLLHKAIHEGEEYSDTFLSNVYRRRGECYVDKGDLRESAFCFKKVLENDPDDTHSKNILSTIEKLQ